MKLTQSLHDKWLKRGLSSGLAFFSLAFIQGFFVFAQDNPYSLNEEPASQSRMQLLRPRQTEQPEPWQAKVYIQNSQYLRSNTVFFRPGAKDEFVSLGVELKGQWYSQPRQSFYVDIGNQYNGGEDVNYFKPRQAYFTWESGDITQLSLGRKKYLYSRQDEFWSQGIWQPRFMDDKLHNDTAGLVGAFWDITSRSGDRGLTVFALPIHIPELGPEHQLQEGRFVSANPWFRPPAQSLRFRENRVPIDYDLARPRNEEVASHPGGGFLVEWGAVRGAYAYKPIPQMLLGFPTTKNLNIATGRANIHVHPRVVYHHLTTLEVEKKFSDWEVWLSATGEVPDADPLPDNWTMQTADPALNIGGTLAYNHALSGQRFSLGFMRLWGGDGRDRGVISNELSLFERRYQYQEAVQIGWNRRFGLPRSQILLGARSLYDFAQKGMVVSTDLGWQLDSQWGAHLRADFMGLVSSQGSRVEDGFVGLYRSNDRVQAGINYVF